MEDYTVVASPSKEFVTFVNSVLKEVVIEGAPIDQKQKWLKHFCEMEQVDFNTIWRSFTLLTKEMGVEHPDENKLAEWAGQCLITEETLSIIRMPRVLLFRKFNKLDYCIGKLYVKSGELFFSDTLEPAVNREEAPDSKKIGAIPRGVYQVGFDSQGLCFIDVSPSKKVSIRAGSRPNDTQGDILLGFNLRAGRLTDSENVCRLFYERMGRQSFILVIKNEF